MKKETLYIVYTIIGFVAGFIIGRQSMQTEPVVRYIKGEAIEKTVKISVPYKVETPAQPIYLYKKTDTVFTTIPPEIDTMAILNDWITRKNYQQDVFNNQYGKLSIDASVQYNKLESIKYSFIPLQKETSYIKHSIWEPYVGVSYSTVNYVGISAGIFYHDLGLEIKYMTDFDKKGVDIGLKYKF